MNDPMQMPNANPPQKNNTTTIIIVVVVVLLCCCCVGAAAGYYLYQNGDQIFGTGTSLLKAII